MAENRAFSNGRTLNICNPIYVITIYVITLTITLLFDKIKSYIIYDIYNYVLSQIQASVLFKYTSYPISFKIFNRSDIGTVGTLDSCYKQYLNFEALGCHRYTCLRNEQ